MNIVWHKFAGNRTWYLYDNERYTGWYIAAGGGAFILGTVKAHGEELEVKTIEDAKLCAEARYALGVGDE